MKRLEPGQLITERVEQLEAENAKLREALQALVSDVLEYERINNLAPNPGKRDCWQSVTRAKAALSGDRGEA